MLLDIYTVAMLIDMNNVVLYTSIVVVILFGEGFVLSSPFYRFKTSSKNYFSGHRVNFFIYMCLQLGPFFLTN